MTPSPNASGADRGGAGGAVSGSGRRVEFAQQPPPPGGYSSERFEAYVQGMAQRLDTMLRTGDRRGVFQLTYLTFSRRILAALQAGRFEDATWASDMCCRFVEAYAEQLDLWELGDESQCGAWRIAFESMQGGRLNVLQSMLLGMNAHIQYDLAFVTLGSCRHAGDLPASGAAEHALAGSRTGVPVVRYRDFLLVNQVAWESIPSIQDTVLRTFSPSLYWGNRLARRVTRALGERILLETRDASWCHTALLIHAREGPQRELVVDLIEGYSQIVAELIGALTLRLPAAARELYRWRTRGQRLGADLEAGLVDLACDNPVVADVALHQLAFVGADPVAATGHLAARGEVRMAAAFAERVLRHAPRPRRRELLRFLESGSGVADAVLEALLDHPPADLPRAQRRGRAAHRIVRKRERLLAASRACLALSAVAADAVLRDALADSAEALARDLRRSGLPARRADAEDEASWTASAAAAFLRSHPDAWVRTCARRHFPVQGDRTNGADVSTLVERVLFLKETSLFLEVEPGVLVDVADQLQPRSYQPGELLLRAGVPSAGIHLVREGEVEVSQTRDGQRVRVALLGPTDTIGELSAMNATPASADCTALTPVRTFFLPTAVLAHLLHQHPRLGIGLIRVLSQRLLATTRRLDAASQPGVAEPR